MDSWFSADGYLYVLSYMSYFLIYVVFAGILYIIIVVFSTNKLYSDINTDSALELESQVTSQKMGNKGWEIIITTMVSIVPITIGWHVKAINLITLALQSKKIQQLMRLSRLGLSLCLCSASS